MKKITSYIIVFVMMLSAISFINIALFSAKADTTSVNIYEETNTYNIDTIRENVPSEPEDPIQYIENQYIIKYDMNNRINRAVAEHPTVTVFTHGYNSSASDWSNNMENAQKKSEFQFYYNEESMVNKVAELYGKNNYILLRAKMNGYKSFYLVDLTDCKGSYNALSETTQIESSMIGKHFIIIFDSYRTKEKGSNDSNNNMYFQFNYMLSNVLYDLKRLDPLHRIPKVNLIGHSRGGITNMQYALDHPDIVANLISLGTPYEGSTTAALFQEDTSYNGDGLTDIITPDIYNDYKERWNNGYNTLYKDINVLAIGSYSTLSFLSAVAHNDKSGILTPYEFVINLLLVAIERHKSSKFYSKIFSILALNKISTMLKRVGVAEYLVDNGQQIILNEVEYFEPDVVWFSDAIIPLRSQLGVSYTGIKRSTKMFSCSSHNYNLKRVAQWAPPAGHNLEPWDEEIIQMVVEELKPSVTDGTENFKYKENANGTVSISGLKSAVESGIIDIPAMINGKTVTGISLGAFAGEPAVISKLNAETTTNATNSKYNILSNITTINIPSSITEIGSDAFNGLKSLTTINFISNSQLQTIEANVFADCVNLKNINLPSGITEIGYSAFV